MCISTQACPPCRQWAQPGCQPDVQRDSASQILTQASQEEPRKFLGKQRSLEVSCSSKSLRGSWMWELRAFRCGSTVGYWQCLFWMHPRTVPGEVRAFQDLPAQLSPAGVKQCNQPIDISSHTQNKGAKLLPQMETGNSVTTSTRVGAALEQHPLNACSGNLQLLTCKTWKSSGFPGCSNCSRKQKLKQGESSD